MAINRRLESWLSGVTFPGNVKLDFSNLNATFNEEKDDVLSKQKFNKDVIDYLTNEKGLSVERLPNMQFMVKDGLVSLQEVGLIVNRRSLELFTCEDFADWITDNYDKYTDRFTNSMDALDTFLSKVDRKEKFGNDVFVAYNSSKWPNVRMTIPKFHIWLDIASLNMKAQRTSFSRNAKGSTFKLA